MTNPITRDKCLEVCGYAPEDKTPFVMSEEELVIFVRASVALGMEMAAKKCEELAEKWKPEAERLYTQDDLCAISCAEAIHKLAEEVQRG